MATHEKVLAVCVNWNGRDVLFETIESLLRSSYKRLDIVVVDNASTDDSTSLLPPQVDVVRLETNLGYGGAINSVVGPALTTESATHFLLLNNDLILAEDTLTRLLGYARDKGPGVFGPRIVRFDKPGQLEAAWGKVTWSHVLAKYYGKNARKTDSRWRQNREVELLLGSTLLVHGQVFKKVGLLDEKFFMYHEEVDFLYRARRSGFPVHYVPSAEVRHHGAHSTRKEPLRKTYWLRRNAVYFLRKHKASTLQWTYFWATTFLSLLYNMLSLRWPKVRTIWSALREGMLD